MPISSVLNRKYFAIFTLAVLAVLVPSPWGLVTTLALLVHAAISTGDLISFLRLIGQVPKNSLVHNHGWKTYWTPLP